MVDIAAENKYISYVMDRIYTDEVKTDSYKVKKGDSLWNLAKQELNKDGKKASNQEISNYMLLIAKMNGMDSYEKMNDLKYDQTIFLPDTDKTSAREYLELTRTSVAKKSLEELLALIGTDESVNVEQSYLGAYSRYDNYNVYNRKDYGNGYKTDKHPLLSFTLDKEEGNLTSVVFDNTTQDLDRYAYDYKMNADGKIIMKNDYTDQKSVGQLSEAELKVLKDKLGGLLQDNGFSVSI